MRFKMQQRDNTEEKLIHVQYICIVYFEADASFHLFRNFYLLFSSIQAQ